MCVCEQAYFAKYDAVALYLSKRKYPPGLTYVEKNTFRRFCKKFAMKGLYKSSSCLTRAGGSSRSSVDQEVPPAALQRRRFLQELFREGGSSRSSSEREVPPGALQRTHLYSYCNDNFCNYCCVSSSLDMMI